MELEEDAVPERALTVTAPVQSSVIVGGIAAAAIAAAGNKLAARRTMTRAGVPVVPGSDALTSAADLERAFLESDYTPTSPSRMVTIPKAMITSMRRLR